MRSPAIKNLQNPRSSDDENDTSALALTKTWLSLSICYWRPQNWRLSVKKKNQPVLKEFKSLCLLLAPIEHTSPKSKGSNCIPSFNRRKLLPRTRFPGPIHNLGSTLPLNLQRTWWSMVCLLLTPILHVLYLLIFVFRAGQLNICFFCVFTTIQIGDKSRPFPKAKVICPCPPKSALILAEKNLPFSFTHEYWNAAGEIVHWVFEKLCEESKQLFCFSSYKDIEKTEGGKDHQTW